MLPSISGNPRKSSRSAGRATAQPKEGVMASTTTTASAVRSMKRSPRVGRHEFTGGPWNSMILALLLVLPQTQAFVSSPASHGYHNAFRRHTAASLAKCCTSYSAADGNGIPRRHAQSRKMGTGWRRALFGRGGRGVRSSSSSMLWMANPEGTQQLRDRDLEFMFYDEAQVWFGSSAVWQTAYVSIMYCCAWFMIPNPIRVEQVAGEVVSYLGGWDELQIYLGSKPIDTWYLVRLLLYLVGSTLTDY